VQVEFGLPDLESRTQIFQIHTRTMNCERNIRFELLARYAACRGHNDARGFGCGPLPSLANDHFDWPHFEVWAMSQPFGKRDLFCSKAMA